MEPDDGLGPVREFIASAQESLLIKQFTFTEDTFVWAVIERHRGGVAVRVMLNPQRSGGDRANDATFAMLHDAGVDCAVLERDATPLGSSALSSGFIPPPGTQAQRAAGIDDSPERFAADISAKAKGRAVPHLVQAYAQAIGPALDALQARHGLQW